MKEALNLVVGYRGTTHKNNCSSRAPDSGTFGAKVQSLVPKTADEAPSETSITGLTGVEKKENVTRIGGSHGAACVVLS